MNPSRIRRRLPVLIALFLGSALHAATVNVTMNDNSFSPKAVTIAVGDTVVWTNQGAVTHTATSGTGCSPSGLFNSGNVSPGGTYSYTFTAAGSVPYYCIPHCAVGMTGTVTVSDSLACTAAAAPLSGPAPLAVTFTGGASGGTAPYAYLWDFGDGQTSTEGTASHTFSDPGIYNWTLTVTDAAAATCMKTGKVSVQAATLACEAAASPESGTAPLTVAFSGSPSGGAPPYVVTWDFGDGETSTAISIAHTYATTGTFEWRFTVTDHNSVTCFTTGHVSVFPASTLACEAGASPEGGAPPLEVAFFATPTGGTQPYAFAWTFGDGGTSTEQFPVHTYAQAGTYDWTATITDALGFSCTHSDRIVAADVSPHVYLSSAARASGAQGTNWRTDAMLFNPGGSDLAYVLFYTPAGMDGAVTPYSHSGTLHPGEAPMLTNFVETLFGLTNSAGSVRFLASGPLSVTSRTYNDTGLGTYGQFAAGQPASAAVNGVLRAGTDGELIGLSQGDRFRTNLGFSEVAGQPVTVLVRFFDAAGAPLGDEVPVELKAFSWEQKQLSQLGLDSADNVRAEVRVSGAGAVLAYASQVDNNTGDAVFQPAQKPAGVAGTGHQLIATIAKAQGGFGTNWLTDLVLYNPAMGTQSVGLEYRAAVGTFAASLSLAAGEVRAITDAVAALFPGAGASTAGALHVTSGEGLLLASRTYNQASDTETYGQFVPAIGADGLVAAGAEGDILQIAHNGEYRTNIGFSDLSGEGAGIVAVLHDEAGGTISTSEPLAVPAGGNLQLSLAAVFGTAHIQNARRVSFQVTSGGPVYGYASVVDNRTGDAVFIPAQPR